MKLSHINKKVGVQSLKDSLKFIFQVKTQGRTSTPLLALYVQKPFFSAFLLSFFPPLFLQPSLLFHIPKA